MINTVPVNTVRQDTPLASNARHHYVCAKQHFRQRLGEHEGDVARLRAVHVQR